LKTIGNFIFWPSGCNQLYSLSQDTVEENRSSFTVPNGDDRHKKINTHHCRILESIHSSLRSKSNIIQQLCPTDNYYYVRICHFVRHYTPGGQFLKSWWTYLIIDIFDLCGMTLVERKTFDNLSSDNKSVTKFSRLIIAYALSDI